MTHPTSAPETQRPRTRQHRSELTDRLLREAADCTDADRRRDLLEQVVVANRGVAEAVAARYRSRGLSQDDLNQVAYEGLTKAVLRFDAGLRNDLLSYAVPTIRGELQRYFRDQGWTIRPPRRIQELQWRAGQAVEGLSQEHGREPTPAEVVAELGVSADDYAEALEAFGCFTPASLDQPVSRGAVTTVAELLPEDGDSGLGASEARVTLAPVVRRLSARDRRILYLRFFEDRTQEEIGRELGVTQMQVSRLLSRILTRLRDEIG
ncbi:sigma-70 family RNA polymerase sigma factor [Nocardioides ferulae]|uniref:sigma-70 family RNA polymerase sigma factor n=1 Tax=Nocardioides ferulae TaxID=2340821 RepID=UPI000EB4A2E7|nr:sigma-70 family RNA polymerase sigma factor [Nocardioides ferulae]